MLSLAQKRVIAVLVCIVVGIAWIDRISSPPPQQYESYNPRTHKTVQKTNDVDAGWTKLDIFTGILAFATVLLGFYTARSFWDSRVLQRAYLAVEPLGINPFVSKHGRITNFVVGHTNIVNVGRLPAIVLR
jgi:hypothetical protein